MFRITSSKLDIIGTDIDIIITLPPRSTLLAIADSPASLQILTVNSVKIAIPVILISKTRNSLFIAVLLDKLLSTSIIPESLVAINANINIPAISEAMMTTLAGLIIVLTMVIKEISTLFDTVRTIFNL